ncbi:hypothetical protein A2973_03855 [Candidatus Gottesmanbacteria bacterium RIFCSPLOWO2_01_FULL_49_10]|uniref:Uncharacterized protein n=1 Tax=Candidatus Gottesmanbacteria bacterium RIFCSPLOWO2_01_FULL_49_10 TaxID=1798396 RepID=A0A1F6AXY2_9BACT|nr:MAG: hypothetical protein A2973_03855 [Candidatus Gottesmanbacteria bacterium RIFCSPLOWO2_01_FULL_49_10]
MGEGVNSEKLYQKPELKKHGDLHQVTFSTHRGQTVAEQNDDLIKFAEGEARNPVRGESAGDRAIKALTRAYAGGTTRNVPFGQTETQVNRELFEKGKSEVVKKPKNPPSAN